MLLTLLITVLKASMYRALLKLTAAPIESGDCISKDVGVEIFVVFR